MSTLEVDASNACIPLSSKLIKSCPPLPTTIRGERSVLDGSCGRLNKNDNLIMYPFGKLIVIRQLNNTNDNNNDNTKNKSFVYRGHTAHVTSCKFSPSGCYVASGDAKGKLRVWSYDNEEHLCKLELGSAMVGSIRDISWDMDSKRICIVGEADGGGVCCKVVQWDTGVTCCAEEIGKHLRGRASSCAMKPSRPMRLVTGGTDDARCLFHKGPPFARLTDVGHVHEQAHSKGVVLVRYAPNGDYFCSVGTDKALCLHHGTSMQLLYTLTNHHNATIYSCAWNQQSTHIITSSADGTVKLTKLDPTNTTHPLQLIHTFSPHTTTTSITTTNDKLPIGLMKMACAILQPTNDIVSISLNGHLSIYTHPTNDNNNNNNDQLDQLDQLAPKCILSGHQAPIVAMAISNHTNVMYTGDSNGIVCQWDTSTNTPIGRVQSHHNQDAMDKLHNGTISSMILLQQHNDDHDKTNNTDDILLSLGWDDQLRITQHLQELPSSPIPLPSQPNAIAKGTHMVVIMTVDGLLLYTHNNNNNNNNNHHLSDFIPLQDYQPTAIAVSKDDTTLYVGGTNGSIYIYTILQQQPTTTTLQLKHTMFNVHRNTSITALQLSNDNTKLASTDTRDVCVWNVTNEDYSSIIGKGRWCFHTQRIPCIAWSNVNDDDSILATGGNDDSIYIWSLTKKSKRVHYPFSHRGGITGLSFLNNNTFTLQSVGADACVNQWDMTDDILKKFK